jgi:hypothetical protein
VSRLLTALVCTAALAALAGCGESDQEKAREVVQDYVDARNEGDYQQVCDLYSESFKEELGVTENCPAFLEEQTSGADEGGEFSLVEVRVNEDRGVGEIDVSREGQSPSRVGVTLSRDGDSWKISGLQ